MGEAIMASVGRSGVLPGIKKKLQTRIFTSNGTFVVPGNIVNNELRVLCFGGGGSSVGTHDAWGTGWFSNAGGGGGYMNQQILNNIPSQVAINVNIGVGAAPSDAYGRNGGGVGGSTFFGSYVSANGGSPGSVRYCRITSDTHKLISVGGNGGSGGGGGYGSCDYSKGGDGEQFGGGGAGAHPASLANYNININRVTTKKWTANYSESNYNHANSLNNGADGGNGGIYGGGGGGGFYYASTYTNGAIEFCIGNGGKGGKYGGNGGEYGSDGIDGKFISESQIIQDINLYNNPSKGLSRNKFGSGGGGGYGGRGGSANITSFCLHYNMRGSGGSDYNDYRCITLSGGGGGGGYGSNGGNGALSNNSRMSQTYVYMLKGSGGGGGGGYGGNGADAINDQGGGGGGYGPSNYGAGGGGTAINGSSGKDGICIVQYYEMVME